ncbi:flavin reductase family protein [Arthrobacter sp. CAU 1506]|nr:flavin reductase family protein [Arthrobacter sp. CAU 1506]
MSTQPLHPQAPDISTLLSADGDPNLIRSVFGCFPTGVAAVTAVTEDGPAVLVASSFQVGISLDPPLVLFAVQHTSTSWPRIRRAERIGVSVLSAAHKENALMLSRRGADRFAGVETVTSPTGAIFIRGASAWLETSIFSEIPAGDHDVVLLRAHGIGMKPERDPLIWLGSSFRALVNRTDVDSPSATTISSNAGKTSVRV